MKPTTLLLLHGRLRAPLVILTTLQFVMLLTISVAWAGKGGGRGGVTKKGSSARSAGNGGNVVRTTTRNESGRTRADEIAQRQRPGGPDGSPGGGQVDVGDRDGSARSLPEGASDQPRAESNEEHPPSPEELAAQIIDHLADGEIGQGIDLLEDFDNISRPSGQSAVTEVPSLDVMRLKRRLFERALDSADGAVEDQGERETAGRNETRIHPGYRSRLDGIDKATRAQLSALRSRRKNALGICRNLLERGNLSGAMASLDVLEHDLEAIPDPHSWSSLRLLRAKCLVMLGDIDSARHHVRQVCDYFHGPDAFGLRAVCQPHSTITEFVEVIDYVLDAELLESANGFVDLHPAKLITRVEEGEYGRGRFLVINPSPVDACLTLFADGYVRERYFSRGVWNLVWDPFLPQRHRGVLRPVCIPPFGQVTIALEAQFIDPTREQIVQISAGGQKVADWRFSTLTEDEPLLISEFVDASYSIFNPFYRTPVAHELYYRGGGKHVTNFRVEASYPCYIEYYDAETGKLLARDVEGDGLFDNFDFDRIGFDNDYNLFPDLVLQPDRPVIPIELEISPIQPIPEFERDVALSIQVLDSGEWLETAQDVILFP